VAIRRFSTADLTGRKGSSVIGGYGWGWSEMDSIATISASGSDGGGGHLFSNIPQTYQHLRLHVVIRSGRSAATDFLFMRLNGDSGSTYAWHGLSGNGSAASSVSNATGVTTYMAFAGLDNIPAASAPSSVFAGFIIDILDYASTSKTTTVRVMGGFDTNASGLVCLGSGLWTSTASVSSVAIGSGVQVPTAGTRYALYGIKG
jgi:hypothetical protein